MIICFLAAGGQIQQLNFIFCKYNAGSKQATDAISIKEKLKTIKPS